MTHRNPVPATAIALALYASLWLTGCAGPAASFIDENRSFTEESVGELLGSAEPGALADSDSGNAAELRHESLVSLRNQGPEAVRAANLLTKTFPTATRAVPYYVERASYEGTTTYIVVEAVGREGEDLADRRLWVISESGVVMLTRMR